MRNPGRAEIARAIPPGSRRVRTPQIERLYLDALQQLPELTELRADCRANVLEVAKILARRASYQDGTTRPTRDLICRLAGISASTWKAARRRLQAWGFLGVVSGGWTQRFRALAIADPDAPNDAAVYVLCIPSKGAMRRPVSGTPLLTHPPTGPRSGPVLLPARARDEQDQDQGRNRPASGRAASPACGAAVAVLRKGPGQRISDRYAAHLARPFLAAGWLPSDFGHAVNHESGGRQHRYRLANVGNPGAWLRWRLARWLGDDGRPRLAPAQQLAAGRERLRADQQSRRERMTAAAAGWVDPAPRAAAIREQLLEKRQK